MQITLNIDESTALWMSDFLRMITPDNSYHLIEFSEQYRLGYAEAKRKESKDE